MSNQTSSNFLATHATPEDLYLPGMESLEGHASTPGNWVAADVMWGSSWGSCQNDTSLESSQLTGGAAGRAASRELASLVQIWRMQEGTVANAANSQARSHQAVPCRGSHARSSGADASNTAAGAAGAAPGNHPDAGMLRFANSIRRSFRSLSALASLSPRASALLHPALADSPLARAALLPGFLAEDADLGSSWGSNALGSSIGSISFAGSFPTVRPRFLDEFMDAQLSGSKAEISGANSPGSNGDAILDGFPEQEDEDVEALRLQARQRLDALLLTNGDFTACQEALVDRPMERDPVLDQSRCLGQPSALGPAYDSGYPDESAIPQRYSCPGSFGCPLGLDLDHQLSPTAISSYLYPPDGITIASAAYGCSRISQSISGAVPVVSRERRGVGDPVDQGVLDSLPYDVLEVSRRSGNSSPPKERASAVMAVQHSDLGAPAVGTLGDTSTTKDGTATLVAQALHIQVQDRGDQSAPGASIQLPGPAHHPSLAQDESGDAAGSRSTAQFSGLRVHLSPVGRLAPEAAVPAALPPIRVLPAASQANLSVPQTPRQTAAPGGVGAANLAMTFNAAAVAVATDEMAGSWPVDGLEMWCCCEEPATPRAAVTAAGSAAAAAAMAAAIEGASLRACCS